MPTFLLRHRHHATECRFAWAAWRGFDSPLRHTTALASCLQGDHEVFLQVVAPDRSAALRRLPPFLRTRSEVFVVSEVVVP